MALVHNSMIRILNCIYLQALNIPAEKETDVQDFMTMIYSWSQFLHIHHDNEEEFFFPWIEDDLGVPHGDVLGDNIKQHQGFRQGLKTFDEYVDAVRNKGEQYSGKKLLGLLDDFVKGDEGLYIHLNEEIRSLEALEKYGDKINWVSWNARLKKQAVANGDLVSSAPRTIDVDVLVRDHMLTLS
jgi:hemerythrin-like domain-containing protein